MNQKLTDIAADMLAYARAHKWDPVGSPVKFQRELGHGLRLTCYIHDGKITLDMERRHHDLERGEAHITRMAFHAPRAAKSATIAPHDGWRGVRMTWDANTVTPAVPAVKQTTLF